MNEILAKYREAAEHTFESDPQRHNEWVDELHRWYKVLRETEIGRQGIRQLTEDPDPYVRLWAASHCLAWYPDGARAVLRALRDNKTFPCSFDAEMTLEEFDNGSLTFDY